MHVSAFGKSQPWQLPRRTAGHGSKADAGAHPLADCQSASRWIAELDQEIDRQQRMVLIGPSTLKQPMANVPADSLVIHGETDDVVPLAATLAWARPQALPVIVFPGVGHFFHGQLGLLKNTVVRELQPRVPL